MLLPVQPHGCSCGHGVLAVWACSTSQVRTASWAALKAFGHRVHVVPAARVCTPSKVHIASWSAMKVASKHLDFGYCLVCMLGSRLSLLIGLEVAVTQEIMKAFGHYVH